ncbi:flagellar hook-associated protein FlgL [Desulfofalx alkaliphila]|uniref:flagellar hook-associated protein FlgL n=1 Tax=Desulfofalx alkaliphila TaxID=105483 RepID=UPI0004E212F3|nr:flagellar hook-associated protein FlgL [Desulfofalx alkaliphila]
MRITNTYFANQVLRGIQGNLGKLARSQEQLATGKRILRLSDDPKVMSEFMKIKSTMSYNEQYKRNIDDGLSYLEMGDTSMGTIVDVLAKANEYTIQAANDTYNAEQRQVIAEQIDKLIDQVVDLANSTVGGKYIYAGTKNDYPPFKREGDKIIYLGNTDQIKREVAAATSYRIDAPGITYDPSDPDGPVGVFGEAIDFDEDDGSYVVYDPDADPKGDGIFEVLFALRDRLNADDSDGLQDSIGELQQVSDHILRHRVAVGARFQHFESLKIQLMDQDVNLAQSLDNVEAADMARLSIEYSQYQLSYNASLAVGANIMQTSLLDFLR